MDKITKLISLAQKDKKFQKELINLSKKKLSEDELNAEIARLAESRGIKLDDSDLKKTYSNPLRGKKINENIDF